MMLICAAAVLLGSSGAGAGPGKSGPGRAGSFLCTTDAGFQSCEQLRQKGKPIQCTRAGKQ